MSVLRCSVVAFAACLVGTVATTRASAAAPEGDSPTAMTMSEAWGELTEGEAALAAGDCVTMCKALHSMARAAQRICALADGGNDSDRQRCIDAKARVEEATKRVLAACPGCNPSPPYAPATVPPTTTADTGDATSKMAEKKSSPTMLAGAMESATVSGRRVPRFTVALVPTALLLPPTIFKVSAEARLVDHLSFAVSWGIGRLATTGGDGHATVFTLGGQLRTYLFGAFSGLYLGADLRYARPTLEDSEHLSARSPVPGLTLGPMLGFKVIAFGGFTFDTGAGFGIVAVDRRREGQPTSKVAPTWELGLGYSF